MVKVFVPPDSACYECAMTERDYQLLNLRYSCPLLSRDEILSGKVPTAPTIASMMAALRSRKRSSCCTACRSRPGSALVFNGVANQFYSTRLPFRDDCLSHETYPAAGRAGAGAQSTVARAFRGGRPHLEGPLHLVLDRELVVAIECPRCDLAGRGDAAAGQGQGVARPTARTASEPAGPSS